ncbi:hypothetical protein PLESTM_000180300 [Pleodorina starrii]|nr:hypothetical protein PLESTM_000180300 [Pleodorina starrii]
MTGHDDISALPVTATPEAKAQHYDHVIDVITKVLQGEDDWVAAMATVSSLLHSAFDYFHWTGFYQAGRPGAREPEELVIGPYQGHLGCLRIPFSRGVCGAAARSRTTQLVPYVSQFPGYIACASSTQSEIVVPVVEAGSGRLRAVLDVDSDLPAAFTQVDQEYLERLCAWLGSQRGFWEGDE